MALQGKVFDTSLFRLAPHAHSDRHDRRSFHASGPSGRTGADESPNFCQDSGPLALANALSCHRRVEILETGRLDGREEGTKAGKRIERVGEGKEAGEADLPLLLEALQGRQWNPGPRGQVALRQSKCDPAVAGRCANPILHLGRGVEVKLKDHYNIPYALMQS